MKVLTVKQPWAWLIVNGHKDVENRNWRTSYKGDVLIHASAKFDSADFIAAEKICKSQFISLPPPSELKRQCGCIIGRCKITNCVVLYRSPWFFGKYGFVIRMAEMFSEFEHCKVRGQLGLWNYDITRSK